MDKFQIWIQPMNEIQIMWNEINTWNDNPLFINNNISTYLYRTLWHLSARCFDFVFIANGHLILRRIKILIIKKKEKQKTKISFILFHLKNTLIIDSSIIAEYITTDITLPTNLLLGINSLKYSYIGFFISIFFNFNSWFTIYRGEFYSF